MTRWATWLVAGVALVGGCDGGGGGGGMGGGDMSAADLGGGGGGPQVAVTGSVVVGGGSNDTPLAGATVTVAGSNSTTMSAADGKYTVMAAAGSTIFLVASSDSYMSAEVGYVVPAAGGSAPRIPLLANALVAGAISGLQPPLTLDPAKGLVDITFHAADSAGGYGATLSAAHGDSFSPQGGGYVTTTPSGQSDGDLVFPNVVAGTTTIMPNAPLYKSCTAQQAITQWRVDPNTITYVDYTCQ
jgi:hypothetical protein